MKRIDTLTLENFKAFQTQVFPLNTKHTLIYGNNGAGKSSIYWALYTLIESVTKGPGQVAKYFVPYTGAADTIQSLRNRYSDDLADSFVRVTWSDDATVPSQTGTCEIGESMGAVADPALSEANLTSDFITYRLFQHFNGSNRDDVSVWTSFVRDIFPYHKTTVQFPSGPSTDNFQDFIGALRPLATWRNKRLAAQAALDKMHRYKPSETSHQTAKRTRLQAELRDATDAFAAGWATYGNNLRDLVTTIVAEANAYLVAQASLPTATTLPIELALQYNSGFTESLFANLVAESTDSWTSRLRSLSSESVSILLSVRITENGGIREEKRPQTYLNEARLTRLAFALRIGALIVRARSATSTFNVLCFDDVLISLDMGNRLEMLDWLFNATMAIPDPADLSGITKQQVRLLGHYQIIFLTHERELFYLFQKYIKLHKDAENPWNIWELHGSGQEQRSQPTFIEGNETYLQRAEAFFLEGQYVACGNALRSHCEQVLRDFLPPVMVYEVKDDGEVKNKLLAALITNLGSLLKKYTNELQPIAAEIKKLRKLNIFKDLLLNPLSHANVRTSVFAEELQILMLDIIPVLNQLQSEFKVPVQFPGTGTVKISLIDRIGRTHLLELELREPWIIQHFPGGISIPSDPDAKLISHTIDTLDQVVKPTTSWMNIRGVLAKRSANPTFELERQSLGQLISFIIS